MPSHVQTETQLAATISAYRWRLGGKIQGVGFRPFVFRLATRYAITGWVRNLSGELEMFTQGSEQSIAAFVHCIFQEAPPLAKPRLISRSTEALLLVTGFTIEDSIHTYLPQSIGHLQIPADSYLCSTCYAEFTNPNDRRFEYPFINCTQCGPRYTIIKDLPYDRGTTTMANFVLCNECLSEYQNPADHRFHAQPLACPACGPKLTFVDADSTIENSVETNNVTAIKACVMALRAGKIVAVKGLGGYHLMCDADDNHAVKTLRSRKHRPDKPFAVMFPDEKDLTQLRNTVDCNAESAQLLKTAARPIVVLKAKPEHALSTFIAPGLDKFGVMLPSSPLHYLLLKEFNAPLIATSANLSGEPMLTENAEATHYLDTVADAFLHHNRPIQRPIDDSVWRTSHKKPQVLRLGRGHTPLELSLPVSLAVPVIAVGAHMKNTITLAWDNRAVISQHLGRLETPRSLANFIQTIDDMQQLYGVRAKHLLCDAHAGYASSRWAYQHGLKHGLPVTAIQHHHAHASALVGCNPGVKNWLVFSWDGTGVGDKNALWGGECFAGHPGKWQRLASFRPFNLPGGEKAIQSPWRTAASVCRNSQMEWRECKHNTDLIFQMLDRNLNSPACSSVGRLFDAAAALTGLLTDASYDAQGPMLLESVAEGKIGRAIPLPCNRASSGLWMTDWRPLIKMLLDNNASIAKRAADFHTSLAHALLAQVQHVLEHLIQHHRDTTLELDCLLGKQLGIGLCGGVFQNQLLTSQVVSLLESAGFKVFLNDTLPTNDASISFGQVIEFLYHA